MDLREQLDAAIGDGPALPPVQQRVDAGRRALRRRRLTVAVGALATVAVLAGATSLATAGQPDRAEAPSVTDVDPAPAAPDAYLDAVPYGLPWSCSEQSGCTPMAVGFRNGHALARLDGAVISRLVLDPMGGGRGMDSAAVEVTHGGRTEWLFLLREGGVGWADLWHARSAPGLEEQTFDEWVADQTKAGRKALR